MKFGKGAKIGLGWAVITICGIYGFYLSRESVIKQRYEHMKIRERMRLSNTGEYERSSRKFSE